VSARVAFVTSIPIPSGSVGAEAYAASMAEPALAAQAVQAPPPASLRVVADQQPPAAGRPPPTPARSPGPEPALEISSYDLSAALALERELGIGHVLAQVLVRRGFLNAASAREFLEAREAHPPSAFEGIERALAVIERHVRAGSKITVHGDYDVDGVCATAILVRALRALGANVNWFLPGRIDDGYGLSIETVRRLAARGTGLLITADCAITAVEEVAAAGTLGLEVVVSDHHQPRPTGELPDCPIVHPSVCGYPCAELCGTAVAYKLAQALGAPTAQEDVELVALATVADLMPLRGENRSLVRQGLEALASTAKPGLRALMAVAGADPSALDAGVLGFRLAPRINAAGRLRRADAGLELLLTEDGQRAAEIAEELDHVNGERRAVEQRIAWEAEARAVELGERSAFVLAGEGWHPGVIGIVASRIVERYHRPVVMVALDGELCSGSARSIPGFDLLGALHECSEHLERYGGHRAAAGLTIRRDRLERFRAALERHAQELLTPELLQRVESVDAIVSGSELGLALAEELELLEPSGIGNPRSRLLVPGGRFGDLHPMGEGRHARFTVTAGGTRTPAVAFGWEGKLQAKPGEPVDATFRLERNFWNGAVKPRLVLRNAWPCAPGPIEVLGERADYLRDMIEELGEQPQGRADPGVAEARTVLNRRGESPLAVLADALAAGGPVLAVCADVPRRLEGLAARIGGFSLVSYHALEREPSILARFAQLVALDPPASGVQAGLLEAGSGFTHLAWGEPELRFAQQMHELEYGLRASLVALYRALKVRERVAGEELERLLRGAGPHGRPARLAGRLIKVLAELELVSLDPELPALAIAGLAPTALERSPSYREYSKRHEDGRRFLSSANPQASG
jgi:single-stranded-DNA-specific exonuclease